MNRTGTSLTTTCDVYDVAQLAGGLPRLVDTAVAILLERGRLTVDGAGRLQAVGTAAHPVEAAVLDLVGPRPRRSVASLRTVAQDDPRLTGVAERLRERGLLRRNALAALSSSRPATSPTAAGRRVLAEWAQTPAAAVALHGPAGMADRLLAERVFMTAAAGPARRPGRRSDVLGRDPGAGLWASGWLGGSWGGGDGGGGGWGGGDGGGCGGGDGGGGGSC